MPKKILKIFLWIILSLAGLAVVLVVLLYLPPVQRFIVSKASNYVETNTAYRIKLDDFRIRFPLKIQAEGVLISDKITSDTVIYAGVIKTGLELAPLLTGRLMVSGLDLNYGMLHYNDTLRSLTLDGNLGTLDLGPSSIGLRKRTVRLGDIIINTADINLALGENNYIDTLQQDSVSKPWQLIGSSISLHNVLFKMDTYPQITNLSVIAANIGLNDVDVNLENQDIRASALQLSQVDFSYLTDTLTIEKAAEAVADTLLTGSILPWTFRISDLDITDSNIEYGASNGEAARGLDFTHIILSSFNLSARSVYNRSREVSAEINNVTFQERSGFTVTDAGLGFVMDTSRIEVTDFRLKTPYSTLSAEAHADIDILTLDPDSQVDANVRGSVSANDIFTLFPQANLRTALQDKNLNLNISLAGRLSRLTVAMLEVVMPGHLDARITGSVDNLTQAGALGANMNINGNFQDIRFLRNLVTDTILREKIDFPPMSVNGHLTIAGNNYAPDLMITAAEGQLDLTGAIDIKDQNYDATVEANNFPVYRFLPRDSLGIASFTAIAKGHSFDPRTEGAVSNIDINIDRIDYRGYPYSGIVLNAGLENHSLEAEIKSDSPGLKAYMDINGEIGRNYYSGNISGFAEIIDLDTLGFSDTPLNFTFRVDATVGIYPDTAYMANITLDSVRYQQAGAGHFIDRAELVLNANNSLVSADLNSGDMTMEFRSSEGLDSLITRFQSASDQVKAQIDSARLDMEAMERTLPPFSLKVRAGRRNIAHDILENAGFGFNNLRLSAGAGEQRPFHAWININGFNRNSLTLDSLNVGLRRNDRALEYFLRLRNRPGNIEEMAFIRVTGSAVDNTLNADFLQRNRSDSVGFDFGLKAELLDSAINLSVYPDNPVFGYIPWKVNSGNYLSYHFDREIYADVRLDGQAQHFHITSTTLPEMSRGAINIDMQGIDIGKALSLLPSPPLVGGILATNLNFGMQGRMTLAHGNLEIDKLSYNDRTIGNIGAEIDLVSDSTRQDLRKAIIEVDDQQVLTAQGSYTSGNEGIISIDAALKAFPLTVLNAFFPEDIVNLSGEASGSLTARGQNNDPLIDGQLGFSNANLTVPMIGTTFGITGQGFNIAGSNLSFNDFGLVAPNNQPLSLGGSIDFSNLAALEADLELYGTNFKAVSSRASGGSQVYGDAFVDVDITASGPVSAIRVRGDVNILNGTDVTYILPESNNDIQDQKQDIVTFVSFADTAYLATVDSAALVRMWGTDIVVNVDIDDNVEVTLNISQDGNNRIELTGEGTLAYTMNTQGDYRFTGRYNLSGGTVVYNPPVISQKTFTVNDGSYVEWTGDIANPSFNITATESVRTTVSSDDNTSRNVNFDITVNIRNTLEDLEIVFDLAAPNDIAIQNQLSSLAPEQRSTQAMALLIYNTYTGPGTTAKVDTNNPLNTFIERELNQWARNSLPGVELSFGINTIDDTGGGQHTDYSYRVSKSLFDDRVNVTVGGSLNPEESTGDNLKNNFVDDIVLEYRLNKRDNMFLKAYRYNTQESILEGEVIETGGGFLARKKVNKLKDLFRFSADPERKRNRRQARDLRKQLREDERSQGVDPAKKQRQDDPLDIDEQPPTRPNTQENGQNT